MNQGLFVSIEGCEGAGKTTQANLLAQSLKAEGYSVLCTREPGGTAISEKIREILLDVGHSELDDRAELLLYLASRAQLVGEVIRPALADGKVVVADRFHHSTLAYQGGARGLDPDQVRGLNLLATGGLLPDVTFILDLPAEVGLGRKSAEKGRNDRMENQGIDFHSRVRQSFLMLAKQEPERIVVLDGTRAPNELAREISGQVLKMLASS